MLYDRLCRVIETKSSAQQDKQATSYKNGANFKLHASKNGTLYIHA